MQDTDNLQICFVTTTQYQFMITDIYARYIYDTYDIKSVVFNRTFPNFDTDKFETDGKYRLIPYTIHNRSVIGQCAFALQCGYLYSFSKWKNVLDPKKKTTLFVFNDMSKLANRLMNQVKEYSPENRIFIVEEGNSTYAESIELKNERLWKLKHTLSKIVFGYGRTSRVVGESSLIDGAIVKDVDKYSSLKKAAYQEVRQQNKNILQNATDFFNHYTAASDESIECDVIYMGQPFYQNGKFYKYEDDCIDAVISAIPSDYRVVIKPHPRDMISKYNGLIKRYKNVSVIKEDLAAIPIEALLGMTKARIVISIQSSASITVAELYPDIRSVVVKNLPQALQMFDRLREIGDEGPVHEDSSFVCKNNNIFLPGTVEDFESIITESAGKNDAHESSESLDRVNYPEIDTIISEMKGKE